MLGELLLDAPTVMGVESIEVDTVTLRMVARTLPGKQFEAGRQLRVLVIRALARAGHRDRGRCEGRRSRRRRASRRRRPSGDEYEKPRSRCSAMKLTLNILEKHSDDEDRRWPSYMFGGRVRTSTLVLIVAFLAVWWVYDTYRPAQPAPRWPPPQVVPPPGYRSRPELHLGAAHAGCRSHRSRRRPPRRPTTTPTTTDPDDHNADAADRRRSSCRASRRFCTPDPTPAPTPSARAATAAGAGLRSPTSAPPAR